MILNVVLLIGLLYLYARALEVGHIQLTAMSTNYSSHLVGHIHSTFVGHLGRFIINRAKAIELPPAPIDSNSSFTLTLLTTFSNNTDRLKLETDTIKNWIWLGPDIQRLNFYVETTHTMRTNNSQWRDVEASKTISGLPVVKNLFLDAQKLTDTTYYAFSNSDILFGSDLLTTIAAVRRHNLEQDPTGRKPFLLVGARTNVNKTLIGDDVMGDTTLRYLKTLGELARLDAIDYFIVPRNLFPWHEIHDVVVARNAWDNYVMTYAKDHDITVYDGTLTITAVHQTYDGPKSSGKLSSLPEINKDILVHDSRYDGSKTKLLKHISLGTLPSADFKMESVDGVIKPKKKS